MHGGVLSLLARALLSAMNATQQVRSIAGPLRSRCLRTRRHHAGIETTDGIAAVHSEDWVKGLVRLVGRVEGRGNPRDAIALPTSLPRGVLLDGRRVIRTRLPPRSGCTPVLGEHTEETGLLFRPASHEGIAGSAISEGDDQPGEYGRSRRQTEASITLRSRAIQAMRNKARRPRKYRFTGPSRVEPAGIEPATSCLQSRSDCPLVSRGVAQTPANAAFLLAAGGHERTARDKLVPPRWPLGVRDLGRREEGGPRLPGCVSSRMRPRPRPLLRRRSRSARRCAAYPQTRPSRGHRC